MKWELVVKHSWHVMRFRFKKITDAEAFYNAFVEAKQPDDDEDDRKHEWKYFIRPVKNEEESDAGDDE